MAMKHVILSFSFAESSYDPRAKDHEQPGPSKPKKLKKKSYKCKYQKLWAAEFPNGPANQNKHAFYCIPCKKNIPYDHQGRTDVVRHCDWPAHKKMTSLVKSSRVTTGMFTSASSADDLDLKYQILIENTTRAELLHVNFIVQHNQSSNHMLHLHPIT